MAGAIIISLFFLFLFFRGAPILISAQAPSPSPQPQQQQENECKPRRCCEADYCLYGPTVRFPFWLKGRHPAYCGYPDPAFALSCSPANTSTILELPASSVKLFVDMIDYERQVVILTVPPTSSINCQVAANNINNGSSGLLPLLHDLSAASSPFQLTFIAGNYFGYEACPSVIGGYSRRFSSTTDCSLRQQASYQNPYNSTGGLSLISCPTNRYLGDAVACINGSPARDIQYIYAVSSDAVIERPLLSCTKLYTVPLTSYDPDLEYSSGIRLSLSWYKPDCSECESKGNKYCSSSTTSLMKKKINNNNSSNGSWENGTTIECFDKPDDPAPTPAANPTANPTPSPRTKKTTGTKRQVVTALVVTGVVLGVILEMFLVGVVLGVILEMFLVGVVTPIGFRCMSYILNKQDQVKIERFLMDYWALKPTRYTYAEIKRITDKFKDKLGQGGYGTVFKGKLSNDVQIAAKILNSFTGNGDDFTNEVGTMGRIHHVNVVRLVGYCADGYKKALVYEYLPNGSLDKVISSDQRKSSLGWEKLRDIALGIARGIEYLHQGCDQRILHFDIKPHNILLDKYFNPKVSDFGLAKLYSKEQSAVSVTAARGTVGYIAPEVFSRNFGNVSHKSDVYSFGMLLLEMVGGRKKNNNTDVGNSDEEVYFPEWIYKRLRREEESGGGGEIEEDGDAKIVKKLTVVGLWCIQWYPGDRPSMKVVVQMLEGDGGGETMAMPPNPFSTTNPSPAAARGTVGGRNFSSILEVISESE